MAENFAGVIDQLRENKEAIDDSKEQNRISLSNVNKNLAFRLQDLGRDFAKSVGMQEDAIQMQRQIADEQERARLLAESEGKDPVSGKEVNMVDQGIIDPVLVTKTALKNAVSVVTTIISADCVISNIRVNESS